GSTAEATEPATPTIAVLPFVNMSGSEDNEYFSDGLTETLLHRLSQQAGLRVAARTSSFAFKDKDSDISEIADKLVVDNVLEGSVQRAGNQVRITAQIIQASDGFHLWSATYDRELDNIFAVQDEIAGEVSEALLGSLLASGPEGTQESGGTTNAEAYDLYLQALARNRDRTERSLVESERLLRRALDLDPDFALAWSALAETLMDHASVAGMDRFEVEEDVLAAARRGVELAPEFSRTVTTLGHAQLFIFQHLSARETFERAVSLNPNDAWALSGLKDSLFSTGDIAGAIRVTQRALALDPLDTQLRLNSTYIFITAGQIDRAIEIAESVLAEDPDSVNGLSALANVYYRTGGYAEAVPLYLRVLEVNPNYANYMLRIAGMVWELGQKDLALQWVDRAAELVPGFAARYTAMFFCTPPAARCAERVHLMLEGSPEDQAFGRAVLAEHREDTEEAMKNQLEVLRLATARGSDFNMTMHTAHAARLADALGRPEQRDELLAPLIEQQEREIKAGGLNQYEHFYLAQAYALKGDADRAVEHLAEAIENGARYLDWYRNSGFFDAVLDDSRIIELLEELEKDNEREWQKVKGALVAAGQIPDPLATD
ncbi:MAG: FlgO family outer membrane protein, partial [Xanthomonadales bacterium]|nr:FlgO family outer membrane protein [Xanthomonadales bacterium]